MSDGNGRERYLIIVGYRTGSSFGVDYEGDPAGIAAFVFEKLAWRERTHPHTVGDTYHIKVERWRQVETWSYPFQTKEAIVEGWGREDA